MKKSIIVLITLIFLVNLVSATDIRTSYYPGETLQIQLDDIFTSNLNVDNFGIYFDDLVHETPVSSGLIKNSGKYFFYAVLPTITGNYSLRLENTNQDFIKNFSIIASNNSYLSISPGQVLATNNFKINIKNYNSPQSISVIFTPTNFKQNYTLNAGEDKDLYFSIANLTKFEIAEIKINSYTIPVIISPKIVSPTIENESLNESEINLSKVLEITPKIINITLMENQEYSFKIDINSSVYIHNLSIKSDSKNILINKSELSFIGKKYLLVSLSSNKDLNEEIVFSYLDQAISIPVSVKITKNLSQVSSNSRLVNLQQTCSSLGGIICNASNNEKCNGIESTSIEGVCCKAECEVQKKSGSWLWGLALIIFLGIGVWFLYKKSKQNSGDEKSHEIIKKRSEEYEKKVSLEDKEVRKSLEK